jgi:hypothetical protein
MRRLLTASTLTLTLVIAGCTAGAAPASPPTSSAGSSSGSSSPGNTTNPNSPPDGGVVGGGPGGEPGGGGGAPADPGQPTLVVPKPGQMDVHDVAVQQLSARVAGRHVVVNARWWSGVEPCNVLDSVGVKRDRKAITIAVREGSSARDAMCIEIAMLKVAAIDLGDLEPGDYTITASQGDAAAITVTVS